MKKKYFKRITTVIAVSMIIGATMMGSGIVMAAEEQQTEGTAGEAAEETTGTILTQEEAEQLTVPWTEESSLTFTLDGETIYELGLVDGELTLTLTEGENEPKTVKVNDKESTAIDQFIFFTLVQIGNKAMMN